MTRLTYSGAIERIHSAIEKTRPVFSRYTAGEIAAEYKAGHDPVTAADRELDALLRENLLRQGEGWLSEESADDFSRLRHDWVWIVDPLDGTREFIAAIPEYCVSIALVERGRPVAGGIFNPATDEIFLGSVDSGITYNGMPAQATSRTTLKGATILASRSETARGEWKSFENAPFQTRPVGSVAYKLALVAAGKADGTFTLSPKNEWDIAAGAALILSAGGQVQLLDGSALICNQPKPVVSGLISSGSNLKNPLRDYLSPYLQNRPR